MYLNRNIKISDPVRIGKRSGTVVMIPSHRRFAVVVFGAPDGVEPFGVRRPRCYLECFPIMPPKWQPESHKPEERTPPKETACGTDAPKEQRQSHPKPAPDPDRVRTPYNRIAILKGRSDAGLTVNALSRQSGVSHACITDLEHGSNPMTTWGTLKKLAAALGLPVSSLVNPT